jgi:hypothetical protein
MRVPAAHALQPTAAFICISGLGWVTICGVTLVLEVQYYLTNTLFLVGGQRARNVGNTARVTIDVGTLEPIELRTRVFILE